MPLLRFGLAAVLLATTAAAAYAQFTPPPLADPATMAPPSSLPPAGPVSTAPTPAPPEPAPVRVPAPIPLKEAPLQAPDLFSAEAGPTGLGSDLWRGASADLARLVIPLIAQKPLSPAAQAFARRLMSTAAIAPEGAGADPDLAAARIGAVLALGDAPGALAMAQHTPGARQSPALSQVQAEADLVLGREDEACAVNDTLTVGKDQPYFRRLRAYCLLRGGDKPGAQLAFDLAAEQAKDDVYKRLMAAAVSGSPPGEASLRNGMEFALSKRLQLDMGPAMAKAWAPIPPVVAKDPGAPLGAQSAAAARVAMPFNDTARASGLDPAVRDAALALADAKLDPHIADLLVSSGQSGGKEAQAAAALYAAAGAAADPRVRAVFATFDIGKSTANQARLLEMDAVATAGAKGDAGPAGRLAGHGRRRGRADPGGPGADRAGHGAGGLQGRRPGLRPGRDAGSATPAAPAAAPRPPRRSRC